MNYGRQTTSMTVINPAGALLYLRAQTYFKDTVAIPQDRICTNIQLSVATTATERSTQLAILVCKIQDGLGQIGCLNDASNLDGTLILDQLPYQVQELGGKLDGRQKCTLT
jgi:hypothetical protein